MCCLFFFFPPLPPLAFIINSSSSVATLLLRRLRVSSSELALLCFKVEEPCWRPLQVIGTVDRVLGIWVIDGGGCVVTCEVNQCHCVVVRGHYMVRISFTYLVCYYITLPIPPRHTSYLRVDLILSQLFHHLLWYSMDCLHMLIVTIVMGSRDDSYIKVVAGGFRPPAFQ